MLFSLVCAPLLAALLLLTQGRDNDIAAGRLAACLAWLIAIFGVFVALAGNAPVSLPLGTLFGTEAALALSLVPTDVGLGMMLLTVFLGPVAVHLGSQQEGRQPLLVGTFLLQSALIGAFLAGDLATFYICFEATLIPSLWMLTRYGMTADAGSAALRFLLYTMAGSFLMLVAIWVIAAETGTLDIQNLISTSDSLSIPAWCGWAFVLAFAVKTPLVPFHGWQRPLYEAVPVGGLALIAGVMGKLGVFGFLTIAAPIFPALFSDNYLFFTIICLCSVIFGALLALRAETWRGVLAYSSLSHLGFAVLAIFAAAASSETDQQTLMNGVLLHMVGHGIAVAVVATVIASLERRQGTSAVADVGGLATQAPGQAVFALGALLIAVAIPGTVSFGAEVMLLSSIFSTAGVVVAIIAGLSLVLTAGYLLRLARQTIFGSVRGKLRGETLSPGELAAGLPMVILAILLGFAPQLLFSLTADAPEAVAIEGSGSAAVIAVASVSAGKGR